MASYNRYPRTLPESLNNADLDPLLRRYHNNAARLDDLQDEVRSIPLPSINGEIPRAQMILLNRMRRLVTENQGYKELVLIYQEAPAEAFEKQVAMVNL